MPAPHRPRLTRENLTKLNALSEAQVEGYSVPEAKVEGYSLPADMDVPPANVPTARPVRSGFIAMIWAFFVSWAYTTVDDLRAWWAPAVPRFQEVWDGVQGVVRLARRSFGRAFGEDLPEILTLFAKDIGRGIGEFLIGALRIVLSIGMFLFNFFEWVGRFVIFDVSGVLLLAAKVVWRLIRAAFGLVGPTIDGIANIVVRLVRFAVRLIRVIYAALERVVRERSLWPRSTMLYD